MRNIEIGKHRWHIINALIKEINAQKYLEIGFGRGINFNKIHCDYKMVASPNNQFLCAPYLPEGANVFAGSSDDFFKENIFPILGYSYYKYAQALQEQQKYNSLVYIEYALEMSDLGMYFPEEQKFLQKLSKKTKFVKRELLTLGEGFLLGVIVTLLIISLRKNKVKRRREDYIK